MEHRDKIKFSADSSAVFVCGSDSIGLVIKVFHPYLHDAGENNMITLWRQNHTHSDDLYYVNTLKHTISHDDTTVMKAVHDAYSNKE